MKTGIITFHAAMNYGSALQAFALQEYLTARGHSVEIIDFRSQAQERLYPSPVCFNSIYNAKQSVRRLVTGWDEIRFMKRKRASFRHFLQTRMQLTDRRFRSGSDLRRQNWSGFGMLVSGSDQIWNVSAADFSTAYFLDFIRRGQGPAKIAYAPSSGPGIHPEPGNTGLEERLRDLLSEYDSISVREETTAACLKESGLVAPGTEVHVMPDPVLLHDADFYRERLSSGLSHALPVSRPYILFYCPGKRDTRAEMLADSVAAGMMADGASGILPPEERPEIVRVTDGASAGQSISASSVMSVRMETLPCGPEELLSLLDGAICTVGTSFHLMAFSMLFGKDHVCPDAASDSRKIQLLRAAGLAPESVYFRFSDPSVQEKAAASLAVLRKKAGTFWAACGA